MDLQISVSLLFILFTTGHSLSCYDCPSVLFGSCTLTSQCSKEFTNCYSTTVTISSTTTKIKGCAPSVCPNGTINFGIGKVSSLCCNNDLCNSQDAPDSSTNVLNGKSCYYCDGQSCLKTVSCSGTEDRCFNATAPTGFQTQVLKGCVSKSFCNGTTTTSSVQSISCCEGNLCNGNNDVTQSTTAKSSTQGTTKNASSAQSVTQSFLFLCCSLLSFILLH